MSTTIQIDLRDEQAEAGLSPASGYLSLRYVNELDDPDGTGIVSTKPFRVDIVDGIGEAEVLPTDAGNGVSVRSYVRGVRSRTVTVPDQPTVQFRDLPEVDPDTLSPVEPPAAWNVALEQAVADLVDSAPGALDTLNELAAALGDDANFATTVTNALATKATTTALDAEVDRAEGAESSLNTALAGKVPTSRTVNGHALSGDVTVTKSDVGLDSVDNTADTAKPVSTAQEAAFQRKPRLDSWPTYIYGNSYGILSAAYFTSGNHYTQQVAAALGGGSVTSYAIAAKRILDVISALQNQTAYTGLVTAPVAGSLWPGVSARNGLIVLESLGNDVGHYPTMVAPVPAALPSANTRYLDSMVLAYRTALAYMSSESRIEQTARTATSGTWTHDASVSYASGGSVSFTTANGAYVEFSVTPPQSGPLRGTVFVHGANTSAATMAQQTVSVDGVVQTTRTPAIWESYLGPGGAAVNVSTDCFAVTLPVDNAAHTIRIAHSGTAGHIMYVDGITIPSVDPNPIAVMGVEHGIAYAGWTAAERAAYHANAKALTPLIKAVVAEFPNAFYVPSTMTSNGLYSVDGLHPNDRGMAQRANDLAVAVNNNARARLESRRLANLANSNFPIV